MKEREKKNKPKGEFMNYDLGKQHPEMFEKVLNKLKGKPKEKKFLITNSDKESLLDFLDDVECNHFEERIVGEHILEVPITGRNLKTDKLELQAKEISKPIKRIYAPEVAFYTVMEYNWKFDVSEELKKHIQILKIKGWYPYMWVKIYSSKDFRPLDKVQVYKELPFETARQHPKWKYFGEKEVEKECRYLFRNKKAAYRQDITI